jgi:hypothetical protein
MKPCEIHNIRCEISALKEILKVNPNNTDLMEQMSGLYNQLDAIQDFEEYREEYVDPFQVLFDKGRMTDRY